MYKDCSLTMSNPAIIPVPVTDVQGDGRWMSIVCFKRIHLNIIYD